MAAGNIKGITIEIGGDTTKLSKALSGVNSSCSSLQKELRELLQGHYQLYWKYIKQTITAVLVGHMETCI